MSKTRWLAAAAALSLAACQAATTNQQNGATAAGGAEQGAADKLARVEMQADTSYLTDEERKVVNLLIQAADLMNPIYLRQVSADNPRIREEIVKSGDKAALDRFDTFMGPWDEVDEDKPFYGNAHAAGRRGLLSRRADQGAVRRLSDQASGRSEGADRPLHGREAAGRQARRRALFGRI